MYGMVGSSGGGSGGPKSSRERSLSRRTRRSMNQYRQASFTMGDRPHPPAFSRSNSSSSVLHRSLVTISTGGEGSRFMGSSSIQSSSASDIEKTNKKLSGSDGCGGNGGGASHQPVRQSFRCSKGTTEERMKERARDLSRMEKGVAEENNEADDTSNKERHSRSRHSRRHRSRRSLYRRILTLIKQAWTGVKFGSDSEEEEIEQEPRHRPDDINSLCRTTHFTRLELQRFYRAFKDRCPTGVITEGAFKEMYCQMFPKGASASQYAHYVFLTLDSQGEGVINFEDLITLLSRLCRGSMGDRLCWIFSLYDLNNDGYISRQEMSEVVQAVYDLLGSQTTIPVDTQTVEQKVEFLFETFDTNKDDLISLDEFIDACSKDITLVHNLDAMANYL